VAVIFTEKLCNESLLKNYVMIMLFIIYSTFFCFSVHADCGEIGKTGNYTRGIPHS
jgi:hypothetical protein